MTTLASRVRAGATSFLASGGMILLLVIATAAVTSAIQPRFFNQLNIVNILRNAAILSVASMGQMLVMVAGGFDLSVGVVVAFASVETALLSGALSGWLPDAPLLALGLARRQAAA